MSTFKINEIDWFERIDEWPDKPKSQAYEVLKKISGLRFNDFQIAALIGSVMTENHNELKEQRSQLLMDLHSTGIDVPSEYQDELTALLDKDATGQKGEQGASGNPSFTDQQLETARYNLERMNSLDRHQLQKMMDRSEKENGSDKATAYGLPTSKVREMLSTMDIRKMGSLERHRYEKKLESAAKLKASPEA